MTMIYTNITTIKDFIIIGFPGLPPEYYGPVSALLLLVFLAIVIGNGFTIAVIICERTLHKSLYVIFCNLAMTDMCFGIVILPKIIARYWWNDMISSFGACFTQMFFINLVEATHCLIFLVMALDRFVAISFPFKYPVVFTNKAVSIACTMCWVITFVRIWEPLFRNLNLPYCDQNIIMQCYCDLISITRLACGDEVVSRAGFVLANAMVTFMVPLIVSILCYFSVMVTVLTMPETERRHKVLSTCAPQIFITCLYYVPRCFVFIANTVGFNFSLLARVVISMMYSLIPPVVNPVIYCFKTKDIKNALMRRFKNIKARIAIRTHSK